MHGERRDGDVAQFVFPEVVLAVKLSLMVLISKNWPSWRHLAKVRPLFQCEAWFECVCQAQGLCSLVAQEGCVSCTGSTGDPSGEGNRSSVQQRIAPLRFMGQKLPPDGPGTGHQAHGGAETWGCSVGGLFGLPLETLYHILVPISMHICLQSI